jgi:hypothetical protein
VDALSGVQDESMTTEPELFEQVEAALAAGGAAEAFDFLIETFRAGKNYPLIFEARLMRKRHELGLPLVHSGRIGDLPEDRVREYEKATVAAAREVGQLFLEGGEIMRAWPYFRAIGEPEPVARAIAQVQAGEGIEPIIEIAYSERVNPLKGLNLILEQYGICRAITLFEHYPDPASREQAIALLLDSLYQELLGNLKRTVASQEGTEPDTASIAEVIKGRDWLFEGGTYYVDTSHVCSVLRHALDASSPEILRKAVDLTEYGQRLAPMFHFKGDPPFENIYEDHRTYLRALLGEEVDEAIAHFRGKVEANHPQDFGASAATLIDLLVRLDRYNEAIEVARTYLEGVDPRQMNCPSVLELCQLAADYDQMRQIAREQGDLLSFAAARLQAAG